MGATAHSWWEELPFQHTGTVTLQDSKPSTLKQLDDIKQFLYFYFFYIKAADRIEQRGD